VGGSILQKLRTHGQVRLEGRAQDNHPSGRGKGGVLQLQTTCLPSHVELLEAEGRSKSLFMMVPPSPTLQICKKGKTTKGPLNQGGEKSDEEGHTKVTFSRL